MDKEYTTSDEEIEIDLENVFINFIVGIKKFGLILIILILVYTGVRYAHAHFNFKPQYSSETTFAVSSNGDDVTELVKTYSHLLTGSMMKEIVIEDLGLKTLPAVIEVNEVENTNFLLLKATASDYDMAYDVVSSILKNYRSTLDLVVSNIELEVIVPPEKILNQSM